MIGSQTDPSYRAITIIALMQAGVVIGGTLFVAVMLKLAGYQGGAVPDEYFNSAARFVRHFGLLLLLLPVAWTVLAVVSIRTASRRWIPLGFLLLGIAGVMCGIYYYVLLGVHAAML